MVKHDLFGTDRRKPSRKLRSGRTAPQAQPVAVFGFGADHAVATTLSGQQLRLW
jgi:hypothetical protein